VLDGRNGDRQARAEALMLLLLACGEKPYRLVHGSGKDAYHLAVLLLDDGLKADAALEAKAIRVGRSRWLVLALEPGLAPGEVPVALRDPATCRWKDSLAIDVFIPPAVPIAK
jgi:hypothetical protein